VQADPGTIGERTDIDLEGRAGGKAGAQIRDRDRGIRPISAQLMPFEQDAPPLVDDEYAGQLWQVAAAQAPGRHRQATARDERATGGRIGFWSTSLRRNATSSPDSESIRPEASQAPICGRGSRPWLQ
jgi:hypothetical protein